jgi:general secretion pathway protein L
MVRNAASPPAATDGFVMALISELKELFDGWITAVDRAIDAVAARIMRPRQILLREGEGDSFTITMMPAPNRPALPDLPFRLRNGRPYPSLPADWLAACRGSRVEILLHPDHVMFRPLDFPRQAGEFLGGMIRAQIDRLTPWSANDAVFGWSAPAPIANERIELTLAATSKHIVLPLVQVASDLDAGAVAVCAEIPAGDAAAKIKLFDQSLQGAIGRSVNVPRTLRVVLLSAGFAAAAAVVVAAYVGGTLEAEQQQLLHRISERRASLRLDPNAAGGSGLGLLAKRKQSTPSSVMVLEAISRVLPDNTFVTELRIEGDKIQVVGMTQDAPSLIRLMEQSPQFTRATFFAPTTRAQNDPGERFHIEAHLSAYFGSGT